MPDTIVIDRRFRGPDDSGNGGWSCGALAGFVPGRAEVTLRQPPPLDRPLRVERSDGGVQLFDDSSDDGSDDADVTGAEHGRLVAEARPSTSEVHWAPFVEPAAAVAAGERYAGHVEHLFPHCFTCGPARAEGDGLRIFTGPVEGRPGLVAHTWTPSAAFAGADGQLPDPVVWAALDCPSAWPHLGDGTAAVLGRMTAEIEQRPEVGVTYVVVGESLGAERRKRFGAAALYTTDGERVAASNATWIVLER